MRRAAGLLFLALMLPAACRGEEERRADDSEAAWDSMVERSRDRPTRLDTMPDIAVPRSDSGPQQ
jgi:hypothetical protein